MSTPNPSYKPSEGKREEFRKYLEKNGVMDALTRVLVNLYEEADKPEDALEYIRDKLAVLAGLETHKQLQTKLSDAEEKIKDLEGQLNPAVETAPEEASAVGDEGVASPGEERKSVPKGEEVKTEEVKEEPVENPVAEQPPPE